MEKVSNDLVLEKPITKYKVAQKAPGVTTKRVISFSKVKLFTPTRSNFRFTEMQRAFCIPTCALSAHRSHASVYRFAFVVGPFPFFKKKINPDHVSLLMLTDIVLWDCFR